MKIAAVVVFYNPSRENIKNIEKYIDTIDKLYVVDNTDDDKIRINSSKKIEYIKLGENKGIASALNIGAKKAIENKYKYLLTLDQDSKMTQNIIKKMITFLEKTKDERIGLISPYRI